MSATQTVPDHFTTQFGTNWELLAQQKNSRMARKVMMKTGCTGKARTHNQVGKIEANETTGTRYARVTLEDLPTAIRYITPREFNATTAEDTWDEGNLLPTIAPRGEHTMAHYASYSRKMDDLVLEAIGGTARTGIDGSGSAALPSTQKVAKDYVVSGSAADSGLTGEKINRALRILADNDVIHEDDGDYNGNELHGVMSPATEQLLRDLINGDLSKGRNLFSTDFVGKPVVDERGRIKMWMGIQWTISTSDELVDDTDTSVHYAYVYAKSGVALDVWSGFTNNVHIIPENNEAVLFLSKWKMGAARLEEEKVVQIAVETSL